MQRRLKSTVNLAEDPTKNRWGFSLAISKFKICLVPHSVHKKASFFQSTISMRQADFILKKSLL